MTDLLKIAVPNKGSLSEKAADMLRAAGYRQRWDLKDLVWTDEANDAGFYRKRKFFDVLRTIVVITF